MSLSNRRILILYGSETGTAQDKAEEIDRMCQRLRFHTDLDAMDNVKLNDLLQDYDLVCFVIATTGQGHFPNSSRKFWKNLRRAKLPPNCLETVQFTTFGLGDSSYHKYNWASRLLHSRLLRLGAKETFARGEADERHDDGIDSIYQPWLKDLKEFLTTTFPLPPSVQPIPEEEPLPPRYTLSLRIPEAKSKPIVEESIEDMTAVDFPPPVLLPHPNSYNASVVSNKRVTPSDHWQDVRLIELDVTFPSVNGVAYETLPGDRVVVYPKNYPSDVQKLIELMEWQSVADKEVVPGPKVPNGLYPAANSTLRDLLTHNIDFMAVPSRSFLHKLAFYTTHEDQKEKLFELVQPDSSQEFYDFTSRPRRTILEVLAEFYSSKIPYEAVPNIFPIIRGREFSIANGGKSWNKTESKAKGDVEKTTEGQRDGSVTYRLDVLAALVEYRTIIRKPREGLCSRYLKNLPAGTPLHVDLKREQPPPNGSVAAERPLIAIATGTGVAPVRSLIHDRSQSSPRAETLLFFGCRNKSADYHFHEEWATTEDLAVIPAFSRDPKELEPEPKVQPTPPPEMKPEVKEAAEKPVTNGVAITNSTSTTTEPAAPAEPEVIVYSYDEGKNYVQHMIRRNADKVCELLQKNAIICLCGNSGRMPKSVREALKDAAFSGGFCKDTDEAEKRLFDEKDPNRIVYWEETW
ncbi:NAPDH-dependent diflavin reductase [Sporothrix stenoceras]|uniref:NADPH-dependent diflavin oxidoreductase 1 n=1 Tax=Sporothrix stenoceras TaxID=5173 RepID=A0ABR3ZHB6_9PEZI